MGTESERVAGFGRLEDGLRQASGWYLWALPERAPVGTVRPGPPRVAAAVTAMAGAVLDGSGIRRSHLRFDSGCVT